MCHVSENARRNSLQCFGEDNVQLRAQEPVQGKLPGPPHDVLPTREAHGGKLVSDVIRKCVNGGT